MKSWQASQAIVSGGKRVSYSFAGPTGASTPGLGITSDEAARRLAVDGPNELPTAMRRNFGRLAWDVVREPMLLLLVGAGTVNFLLSEPLDAVILMLTVVVVIGISIYQERKTENALAALRDMSSPRALVIRDGVTFRIAGRDVVRGDVVLLSEGDRVPADAVLVEAVNIGVDESALTGESVPVRKTALIGGPASIGGVTLEPMGRPGGDATPWVFSGTLVVKGHGTAVVRSTGAGTELGLIGKALRSIETERTPLQREIGRIVGVVAVAGAGAAVAVLVIYGLTRGNWLEGALAGIATAMAMLPEEFPVVLTVFLALGAWRMSRRNVLTRRPPVIETLGTATVVCVDKTGTLTMNSMTIRSITTNGVVHMIDGDRLSQECGEIVRIGRLAAPAEPFDPMDRAFSERCDPQLLDGWMLLREYPLSESVLAVTHVWQAPDSGGLVIATKGAPESVAGLCRLDADARALLMSEVEAATLDGQRALAVARGTLPDEEALPSEQSGFELQFLGLVGLLDPVRPGVVEAIAECSRAGVRTVMITGDYPGTAMAIAREIGLDHAEGCISGPELESMSDEELARRISTVSVFARMVPEQKLRLVRALKMNGEVVGMTGDGVNDAPALRAADIGIAMGGRGTDVARESAGLVITDDDFASIVGSIRQGRGIFDNLRKAMAYLVAVHVVIFGMSLVPVLGPTWPLVLLPLQIALIELIIDPACSVVFEAEEIDPKIMDQPPRGLGEAILSRRVLVISALQGLTVLAAVLSVFLWAVNTGRPDEVVRSLTFAALVIGNLSLILVNRSWRLTAWQALRQRGNRALKWIIGAASGLLVVLLSVPGPRNAFNLGAIELLDWLVVLIAGVAGVIWFEAYKLLKLKLKPKPKPPSPFAP